MNIQLTRSRTNKLVGGVAGGIADAYGWDPTLVRLAFVLLTLTHGIGLLIYAILWVALPLGDTVGAAQPAAFGTEIAPHDGRNRVFGYVLLGIGALMLASMLDVSGPLIAVLLLGTGWYLLRRR